MRANRPIQRRLSFGVTFAIGRDMRLALVLASMLTVDRLTTIAGAAATTWDCGIVALVTRVFDGDTVEVAGLGRVRLLGIDAPEIGGRFERPAPFALEARDELQSLLLRRWARFECDEDFADIYGRRLAYVTLETGEFINVRLVRDGLARVSARRKLRRWDELREAERDAQTRRRGMWGGRPRVPPDSYRLRR